MTDKREPIRQGDVILWPIPYDAAREQLEVVPDEGGRLVLAHGEVTGHHHSFAMSERVALFRDTGSSGTVFLSVRGADPVPLQHQEHHALLVEPGQYEVIRQQTVSSTGVARMVQD
jgi:hypothetical protein